MKISKTIQLSIIVCLFTNSIYILKTTLDSEVNTSSNMLEVFLYYSGIFLSFYTVLATGLYFYQKRRPIKDPVVKSWKDFYN